MTELLMVVGGLGLVLVGLSVLVVGRLWRALRPRPRTVVLRELDEHWRAGVGGGLGREPTPEEWAQVGRGLRPPDHFDAAVLSRLERLPRGERERAVALYRRAMRERDGRGLP